MAENSSAVKSFHQEILDTAPPIYFKERGGRIGNEFYFIGQVCSKQGS